MSQLVGKLHEQGSTMIFFDATSTGAAVRRPGLTS